MITKALKLSAFALLTLSFGCNSNHSVLAPAAESARSISQLCWHYIYILGAVYGAVFVAICWCRARSYPETAGDIKIEQAVLSERNALRAVGWLTAATGLILSILFADNLRGTFISEPVNDPNALNIELTGHQWWWGAKYNDALAANVFETANEIHIPLGRTVVFTLQSPDVIHSLWVPALDGKKDLVPGHPATVTWKVDQAGVYRGQCAEFCGYQHAHMALEIVAEPPAKFAAWQAHERTPTQSPSLESARKGKAIFLNSTCAMCHTIEGTLAGARTGPVLTHVASRHMLAAGTIPNTRGNLANWILRPQAIKPGSLMPATTLAPDDLNALLDYLQSLE